MRDRAETNGFSSSDKSHIESLYREICGKAVRNTGCNDCYKDAYIETYLTLKRNGKMPKKPNYILKAGVVISKFGSNKFYGLSNCPDDVAEDYIRKDESRINLFESFPKDWHDRVFKPKKPIDDGADGGDNTHDPNPDTEKVDDEGDADNDSKTDGTSDGAKESADAEKAPEAEAPAEQEAAKEEKSADAEQSAEQPTDGAKESADAEKAPEAENKPSKRGKASAKK